MRIACLGGEGRGIRIRADGDVAAHSGPASETLNNHDLPLIHICRCPRYADWRWTALREGKRHTRACWLTRLPRMNGLSRVRESAVNHEAFR